jgi:hypothetical protein
MLSQFHVLQSLGTYCGCERHNNACPLCPDGSKASFTDKYVEFVKDELGGITPTCTMLEAYAESFDGNSRQCATEASSFPKKGESQGKIMEQQ